MKPNIGDLMKQAQQLQEQMQKAQEKIASIEVTGESGAGLVKVLMTGRHDVRRIDIDPSLLKKKKKCSKICSRQPLTMRCVASKKAIAI